MTLTHTAELEVDGLDTECEIEFVYHFGDIQITKITNLETGDAIDPKIPVWLDNELYETAWEATV